MLSVGVTAMLTLVFAFLYARLLDADHDNARPVVFMVAAIQAILSGGALLLPRVANLLIALNGGAIIALAITMSTIRRSLLERPFSAGAR